MLFVFFSFITAKLDLSNIIDGLEHVEYEINTTNQEAVFFVDQSHLVLIYQKMLNMRIEIFNNNRKLRRIRSPFPIPKNSIVKIKANWDDIPSENYIIGFINGKQCDIIFYSNLPYDTFEPQYLFHFRKCYYHFRKNSTIKIGQREFKNLALNNFNNEITTMISQYPLNDISEIKGVVSVYHEKRKKNILEEVTEPEDELEESGGLFIYVLSILFNCIGIILYWIFGLAFGTDSCDCTCSCCCCCKQFWSDHNITNLKYDDRDNDFFSETLPHLYGISGQVENE